MTSYDYSSNLTPGKFMRNATSQFLENLDGLREEAIKDDAYMKLSEQETHYLVKDSGTSKSPKSTR